MFDTLEEEKNSLAVELSAALARPFSCLPDAAGGAAHA